LNDLKQADCGWLETEEGNKCLVHVWIGKNKSYLSNGMIVSKALNIVEDRNIQLTYLIEGNRFKVALLPIEQNPKFNTSSTTNPTTMYHAQSSNQVLAATTFNPVINNIDSLDYNFHGGYQWEKIVTAAQASHKKRQTLVCINIHVYYIIKK
jgi:hypothetical protein